MTPGGDTSPDARALLKRGSRELTAAGVTPQASRDDAELLLRHALGCSRESFLARMQEPVPAEARGLYLQLIERRKGRVPIQYLIGSVEFFGLTFRVTPAVLIPRPDTECLVEEAITRLAEREPPRHVVDVGCGSGCIAVALCASLPGTELTAIEASHAALAVARENAIRNGVGDRIRFVSGDLLEPIESTGLRVDAVVSNPPYVDEADLAKLEPEVSEHEPRMALDGGERGLEVLARLVSAAPNVLLPGGLLLLEIGHGQAEAVEDMLARSKLVHGATVPDLSGIPRVVVATA